MKIKYMAKCLDMLCPGRFKCAHAELHPYDVSEGTCEHTHCNEKETTCSIVAINADTNEIIRTVSSVGEGC